MEWEVDEIAILGNQKIKLKFVLSMRKKTKKKGYLFVFRWAIFVFKRIVGIMICSITINLIVIHDKSKADLMSKWKKN